MRNTSKGVVKVAPSTTPLLISLSKPYKGDSADTIRRLIKDLFTECKIFDFPHTVAVQPAPQRQKNLEWMEVERIMTKACWKNSKTFFDNYKKDIMVDEDVDFKVLLESLLFG